ncbi:MAG: metal-dependent hydrolase [Methanosaeta sp. PtaU1.Bin060]|nr:MAG: metal-dependent hydrolase [Methanosaeta sp. PtaU1.Bin060]
MQVTWLGHSCFLLRASNGIAVLLDPFDEEVGYPLPDVQADIVLISHEHTDHNNEKAVRESPLVIRKEGLHSALGIEFLGISTWHDREEGRLRGENTIFCFTLDGVRVCHLGDLGHLLSDADVKAIGPVNLLFIPVGGVYTIGARDAFAVMQQLDPDVAIPMHYQTSALSFELEPVDDFLKGREYEGPLQSLTLRSQGLQEDRQKRRRPSGKVVLLRYPGERGAGSID